MTAPERPLPVPDRDSRPWWAALARGELVLQRCSACATWRWPARAMCGRCGAFEHRWHPISGRGVLASWIVNHHAFSPAFPSPYAVVWVRLEEQDDLLLVGSWSSPIEEAEVGAPVEAVLEPVAGPDDERPDGVSLLSWRRRTTP